MATEGEICPQVADNATLTDEVGMAPLLKTVKLSAELAADAMLDGVAAKLVRVITGEATVSVA